MRSLVHFLLLCLLPMAGWAQSSLPPCPAAKNAYWHNCVGTFNAPNGDKFVGKYKDNKRNGQGTYTFANGRKYVGEYKDDKRNGQGTFTWPDGEKYVGEFKDDKYNGQGTYTFADGRKYVGEYKDDKRNGQGTFTWPDGEKYVGEYKDDKYNGQGTYTFADGLKYVGEYKDDKYNGQGTLTWPDGDKYVGEFKDGLFHGQGTYTFADGRKYVGEFKDDKYNGQGTETFADGRKYVGEFKDDKYSGQGTLTLPSGAKYVGEFKGGKFDGQGTLTFPSGEQYVGQFKEDKRDGQGTETLANGEGYVGQFKGGKRDGQGTLTLPSGDRYVGEFKDDKYNGQGTYTTRSGAKFVGEYEGGKLNGKGIAYRSDGSIDRSGQWVDDRLTQSFVLDRSLFPFDGSTPVAPPLVDAAKAERDRLVAEAESARRRQQELEAQLAALQSQSASRPSNQAAIIRNQRRVALVIGNASYKISPLENPVNDATDVDQTLRQLGFQTTLVRNATLGQMREATRRFADQLGAADVALIYFAGHGIESNRKNYMIPVNADLKFEYELDDQAYNAGQWLEMLDSIKSSNAERVNIVILDACRNNSLIGARSLGRGLVRMDAPTGTFLAYSTAPGKVAADGVRGQRNSPFTRHLLTVMQQPGLPIEEAFKEVRRNVSRETNGAQVPWESTSLTGFFTFRQVR
jgi:hypothetical protein